MQRLGRSLKNRLLIQITIYEKKADYQDSLDYFEYPYHLKHGSLDCRYGFHIKEHPCSFRVRGGLLEL